jgi:hypothetical protein
MDPRSRPPEQNKEKVSIVQLTCAVTGIILAAALIA